MAIIAMLMTPFKADYHRLRRPTPPGLVIISRARCTISSFEALLKPKD